MGQAEQSDKSVLQSLDVGDKVEVCVEDETVTGVVIDRYNVIDVPPVDYEIAYIEEEDGQRWALRSKGENGVNVKFAVGESTSAIPATDSVDWKTKGTADSVEFIEHLENDSRVP